MDKKDIEKNKYKHLFGIILFSLGISLVMTLLRYILGYRKIIIVDLIVILIVILIAVIECVRKVKKDKTKYAIILMNLYYVILLFLPSFENLGSLKNLIAAFTYVIPLSVFGMLYYFWNKFYSRIDL